MLEKYTLNDKDFEKPGIGKLWMKRFVTAKDLSFRAGINKLNPGDTFADLYWYHEFLVVLRGTGKYTCEGSRWSSKKKTFEAKADDIIYIQKGTKWKVECISDEPHIFFYCAVPASSKGVDFDLFPITEGHPY